MNKYEPERVLVYTIGRFRGEQLVRYPNTLENYKWLKVSLEIIARTALEKHLDSQVQLLLEGRPVRPAVNTLMT